MMPTASTCKPATTPNLSNTAQAQPARPLLTFVRRMPNYCVALAQHFHQRNHLQTSPARAYLPAGQEHLGRLGVHSLQEVNV